MAKSLIVNGGATGSTSDNLTIYYPLTGRILFSLSAADIEIPVRDAGTFSNLYVNVTSNSLVTVNGPFTLQKSQTNTALAVVYTPGQTGIKEDTINTVIFTDTDEVNYASTIADDTGSTGFTYSVSGVQFTPTDTSKTISFFTNRNNPTSLAPGGTSYFVPNGTISNGFPDTIFLYTYRTAAVSSDLYAYVSVNTLSGSAVFKTRKNSVDANQSVTYTTTQTGAKEDTTNTDTYAINDTFSYAVTRDAGTGIISIQIISSTVTTYNNNFVMLGSSPGLSVGFNVTTFTSIEGLINNSTTESNKYVYPYFSFRAKELVTYVSSNTIATDASVITLRDNLGNGTSTVSYAAAETGWKNDATNTDVITANSDEIDYQIATPNTSGGISFTHIGTLGQIIYPDPSFFINNLRPAIFKSGIAR